MGVKEKWQQWREAAKFSSNGNRGLVTEQLSVFRFPVQSVNLKHWANQGKLRAI